MVDIIILISSRLIYHDKKPLFPAIRFDGSASQMSKDEAEKNRKR